MSHLISTVPFKAGQLADVSLEDGIEQVASEVGMVLGYADSCSRLNLSEAEADWHLKARRMAKLVLLAEAILPIEDEVRRLIMAHKHSVDKTVPAKDGAAQARRRHFAQKCTAERQAQPIITSVQGI